jgi:SET domain-containing protein
MSSRPYLALPDGLVVHKSKIHGHGIFTTKSLPANHDFGITHVADTRFQHGYIRTPLGGFVNHSETPNCEFILHKDTIIFRTLRKIEKGEELTARYFWYKP